MVARPKKSLHNGTWRYESVRERGRQIGAIDAVAVAIIWTVAFWVGFTFSGWLALYL